jgi:signal transduction histidine kinase
LNPIWQHPKIQALRLSLASQRERAAGLLLGSLLITGALFQFSLNSLEATLYDLRIAGSATTPARNDIVLVTLDDRTTQAYDELAPLTLEHQNQLIERLRSANPKSIGWLLDLNRAHHAAPDQLSTGAAKTFVQQVRQYEAQGGAFVLGTSYDLAGEVLPPAPLNELRHGIALIHKDANVFAEDKVTRRALWSASGFPSFHALLARNSGSISHDHIPTGTFESTEAHSEYFFFRWAANPAVHFDTSNETEAPRSDVRNIGTNSPWTWISWVDVVAGKTPREALENKIILVGELSYDNSLDFAFTPWSRKTFTNPKLAIHANILQAIRDERTVIRGSRLSAGMVTFIGSLFVLTAVVASTPIQGLLATVGLALGFLLVTQILFAGRGLWIPSAHPLIGILASYYIAVPYRLFREYQARWDFQKRNEILTQVEEMKRNFVSLVTHDLKTPVARIQGLAEVVSRKAADRLNERDQESLKHIIDSTEELNRFISSILELNRIDSSQDFSLNLESKDVNELIEKAAERFKAPARAKGIKIELELEPQFPLRIDMQLVTRVLHNLIDNAIKYSTTGGSVRIQSRDWENGVEIRIADQGIGIGSDDLEKLFTRFHRAKNDITTRITGTGLGLYLSRYFIEAHGGTLDVESILSQGSTFTIRLPVEPPARITSTRKKFFKATLTGQKEPSHA